MLYNQSLVENIRKVKLQDYKQGDSRYRRLVKQVLSSVEKIGKDLSPDGDWMPVAIISTRDSRIIPVALPPEAMDSPESKHILWTAILPGMANKMNAEQVAVVSGAWMLDVEGRDNPPRPSESKDRIEVVAVTVVDRERAEIWTAEIKRSAVAAPQLDDWVTYLGANAGGAIAENLMQALR